MPLNYTYQVKNVSGADIISIIDLCCGRSVTNSIEQVVKEIKEKENITGDKHLVVYRDTQGIWDGYDTKEKVFVPLVATDEDEAIRRYLRKKTVTP